MLTIFLTVKLTFIISLGKVPQANSKYLCYKNKIFYLSVKLLLKCNFFQEHKSNTQHNFSKLFKTVHLPKR